MNDVSVDPAERTARAGAGALWSDVIAAPRRTGSPACTVFRPGSVSPATCSAAVWARLARRYGLASDHVRCFEVATADGERRHVDARREPDLLWALRGGGGAGVIVTSIELELVALQRAYAGVLLWPMARAGEIAHAYREWIRTVPDTVTSSLRLMHFPPPPELPDVLRGRALAQLTLAFLGEPRDGHALIAPLRALALEIDRVSWSRRPTRGDRRRPPVAPPARPQPPRLLASLTTDTIDTLVALAGPAVTVLEVRHLGGALRRLASPGAAGALHAEALVFASGVPATPRPN